MPSSNHTLARPSFSIGFNFDRELIAGLIRLNGESTNGRITEAFGALPDSPVGSARPTTRLPCIGWAEFAHQVHELDHGGIAFNYLMNTQQTCDRTLRTAVRAYLKKLGRAGVSHFTMGTPELCSLARDVLPDAYIVMSITRGIRAGEELAEARDAGADAAYLDGVHVNRDIQLLRELIAVPGIRSRLYANMSCLSECPVVDQHYNIYTGQDDQAAMRSDIFWAACSMVKLRSPIEWIQMPWIRPEDVDVYHAEGVEAFKLSDRLASTEMLLRIAGAYLSGKSPQNLFTIVERDGVKYEKLVDHDEGCQGLPMYVHSDRIPRRFIEHFFAGECQSRDHECPVCTSTARAVVEVSPGWIDACPSRAMIDMMPPELVLRDALYSGHSQAIVVETPCHGGA